jgi:transposase
VHPTQLRNWVKAFADDPQDAFLGQGRMKPGQLEIARLKRKRRVVPDRIEPTTRAWHR